VRVNRNKEILALKSRLRKESLKNLPAAAEVQSYSHTICRRVVEMDEYRGATRISTFVSLPTEVQTQELMAAAWRDSKQVAVPCCMGAHLELFLVKSLQEVAPRTLGILEPCDAVRGSPERRFDVGQVDLFVVPGLAFDRRGGRLGHGKGYYDRLLEDTGPHVLKLALAFECQLVPRVPMTDDDVFMDCVITERAAYGPAGC
jgi:5-formyltetrahydrofolate cyclo-ligase